MILRLLETFAIMYCTISYCACAYILVSHKPYKDIEASLGLKILAGTLFFLLAPLMMADVFLQRLRGKGPGGVA